MRALSTVVSPLLSRRPREVPPLLRRSDDPVPPSYWVTATLGALVVLFCYATAWWVPQIVADFGLTATGSELDLRSVGVVLFGTGLGLLVATAPFLALRWPWLGIGVALVPGAFCVLYGAPVPFGLFAALGAVALTASWRRPLAGIVSTGVALAVAWLWVATDGVMAAPFRSQIEVRYGASPLVLGTVYSIGLLLVLGAALWLRLVAVREVERRGLHARAGQVEEQGAVVAERARLSRDLHDVVAHHVSLIAVRAETAPYTAPDLPPAARTVLAEIAADARLALDELRGVLGILGRAEDDPSRAPQPSWGDVPALAARAREAGASVTLEGDLDARVAPGDGYVVYRVVQEALTNARKHGPGHPVLVRLEATSALLVVRVVSGGAVPGAPSAGGHGLVGMRERVEAVGGRLATGCADGEFRVEATLPRTSAT